MNWKAIKQDCTLSYQKVSVHFSIGAKADYYGEHYPNIRELYELFEIEGIYINVTAVGAIDYRVEIYVFPDFDSPKDYLDSAPNRNEAEEWAFKRAFEILEKRLGGEDVTNRA